MSKKTIKKVVKKAVKKVRKPNKIAKRTADAKAGNLSGVITRIERVREHYGRTDGMLFCDHMEIKVSGKVYSCDNITGQPAQFLRDNNARKGSRIRLTTGSIDENLLTIKSIDGIRKPGA